MGLIGKKAIFFSKNIYTKIFNNLDYYTLKFGVFILKNLEKMGQYHLSV